jgi:parvulin-like peptidyl-prolyl isomerase
MHKAGLVVALLVVAAASHGCGDEAIIARCGDFTLTPDDLRFEVLKLGPSFDFKDTFDGRKGLVDILVTRSLLSDEAAKRGYGEEDVTNEVTTAERTAVGEAYHKWKIEKAVRVPRVESKTVLTDLDRRLHVKEMVFAVRGVAEEALGDLRAGQSFDDLAAGVADRQDITVTDQEWKYWKDFDKGVANVLFQLHPGDVSDILRGGRGYSIYYLAEDAPWGATPELIRLRSKRFVRAIREAALEEEERNDLRRMYHVRYSDQAIGKTLRAFALAFAGERPPDSLLAVTVATFDKGSVSGAYLVSYYFSLPQPSLPYVGDAYAIEEFALDTILPQLEAAAGYSLGFGRLREVIWSGKNAREEFLIPKMEESFSGQIVVTPEDRINYYNKNRSKLVTPMAYRARRILVDSEETARQVMRELRSGRDFADVAKEQSLDKYTAPNGGDLGNVAAGMITVYDSIVTGLQPGEITRPFKTAEGVEILKLEEKEDAKALSFEEVSAFLDGMFTRDRANELMTGWANAQKAELGLYVNEGLLKAIELPEPEWRKSVVKESRPEEESAS